MSETGVAVRVVSMPCTEIFCRQDANYREAVLPSSISARIAIEAGHEDYWHKFVGNQGRIIGMTTFGKSAPGNTVMAYFGFTVANVLEVAKELLHDHR